MHTVFPVFFFICSPSLILQLLPLRVLLMMRFQSVVDIACLMCLSLPLICCLGVPASFLLPPTFAAYCTHFCFCPVACFTVLFHTHISQVWSSLSFILSVSPLFSIILPQLLCFVLLSVILIRLLCLQYFTVTVSQL